MWLAKDVQRQAFEDFGVFPARRDLWEEALPDPAHQTQATKIEMAESPQTPWGEHPKFAAMAYTTPGPHLQEALQGKKSADQIRNELL